MSGLQLYTRSNLELLFDFDFSTRDADKSTTATYSVFSHQDTSKIGEILIRSEVNPDGSPLTQTTYPKVVGLETLADGSKKILIRNSNSNPRGNAIHLNNTYFYFIDKFDMPTADLDVSLGFYLDMEVNLLTPTTQLISPFTLPLIMFRAGGTDPIPVGRKTYDGLQVKIVFNDGNIKSAAVGKLYLHEEETFDFTSDILIENINKITIFVTKKEDTPQIKYELIFKLNDTKITLDRNEFSGVSEDLKYPINPFNFSNRYVGKIGGGGPWQIYSLFPGTINKFKFTPYNQKNTQIIAIMDELEKQKLFKDRIYDLSLLRPSYYYNFKKTKLIETTNIGRIIGVKNSGEDSTLRYGNLKKFTGAAVSNSAEGDLNNIKSTDGTTVDASITPILKEGANNYYYYDLEQDLASNSKNLTLDLSQGFAIKMKMDLSSLLGLTATQKIGLLNMRTDTQGFKIALEIAAAAGEKGKLIFWEDTADAKKDIKVDLQTELEITKLVTIKEILILAYPDLNDRRLFVWIKYQDSASLDTAANNIFGVLFPTITVGFTADQETAKKTAILDLGKKAFSSVPADKKTSIIDLVKKLEPSLFPDATNDKYLNSSFAYFDAADITSGSDSQKKTAADAAIDTLLNPGKGALTEPAKTEIDVLKSICNYVRTDLSPNVETGKNAGDTQDTKSLITNQIKTKIAKIAIATHKSYHAMKEAEKGVAHGLLHAVANAAVKISGKSAPAALQTKLAEQQATVIETYTKEIDNQLFTSILSTDGTKSLNNIIPMNLKITTYNSIGVVYDLNPENPDNLANNYHFQGRLESFEFYQADDILRTDPTDKSSFEDLTEDSIRAELASLRSEKLRLEGLLAQPATTGGSSGTVASGELPSKDDLEILYQYNELDGEYDKLMSKKDKILQQDKKHELILRSSKNIQKKIGFYNQQIKRLKIVTLIVHIILAVIIIVALVYQNIGKFS